MELLPSAIRPPAPRAMLTWLHGGDVVTQDGTVLSWSNAAHPGYPYPEAAALVLSLLAQEGPSSERLRGRIAARLERDVSPCNGVGRGGREYVFDTAMTLSALLAHERAGAVLPDPSLPDRLFEFIATCLFARRATGAPLQGDDAHWSTSYGPHLLKVAISLCDYEERTGGTPCRALIDQLVDELAPLHRGGRYPIHPRSDDTYVHASCYAIEGLLVLSQRGVSAVRPMVVAGADWLASVQQPDGGIAAWHGGTRPPGACHADVAAQAIRIWASVDRGTYRREIGRGLEFLARLETRSGGLRYHAATADINTWATVFAIQAVRWGNDGSDGRCLV